MAREKTRIQLSEKNDEDESAFLGSKKFNITGYYPKGRVEEQGDSRVKISFIHPATSLPTIVRTILEKRDCRDARIYRISSPALIRFNNVGFIILKHNHKLLSAYKKDVKSRGLNPQEKNLLLQEAKKAKKAYYDNYYAKPQKDYEGYDMLIPTIFVQGYYLEDDFWFIQRKKNLPLEDWTKDLN